MADTSRIRFNVECVKLVSDVAHALARRRGGCAHVLEVTTYLPLDVESVGRILDGLEDEHGVARVQKEAICFFQFSDEELAGAPDVDLERADYLDQTSLLRVLGALREDEDWIRRVREQHEILQIAAGAKSRTIELAYFTSRSDLASAKIQSILNDFGAEGYVDIEYDEETDTLTYTFPVLDYPRARFQRNMDVLRSVEARPSISHPLWIFVVIAAFVLLAIVILIRFS